MRDGFFARGNPSYLSGLPADHRFKRNENVFPCSAVLASLEVLHLEWPQ